ncbi:MAG: peptidoglycan editing factor PgeF [Desulfobacteraceae bacterium]|jgi:YfiH family protein
MRLIHDAGLKCFQFPALAKLSGFFHGIFPRRAAVGQIRGDDFNLGLGDGTSHDDILRNRKEMLAFFGSDYWSVYANQVHGKGVGILKQSEEPIAPPSADSIRLDGDALISDMPAVGLVIQVADCQPIIIVDPVKRVVANIHSGWRGSIQNVIGKTVARMASDLSCRPENLICGIGPSLGPCCAEFVNYKKEIPDSFWEYRSTGDLFDFWRISMDQLIEAGVRPEKISVAGMCTKCNQHLFFSYRGEKYTGRFAAVVGIRPDKSDKWGEHGSAQSDG